MFADSLRAGLGWRSMLILLASCLQNCMTYTIAVCSVKNSWWWTEELSETCRDSFQNKFEKLVHLDGFIIRIRTHKLWQTDAWRKILMYPNMSPKQPDITSSWNNFFAGNVQRNSRLPKTVSSTKKMTRCKSRWHDDSQWHYAVYEHLHMRPVAPSSEGAWKRWYVRHL